MTKCNKSNFNHVLYNQNRARVKSGDKLQKAINSKIVLLQRKEKEGDTKWIQNAMMKADARLKAMGVSAAMIQKTIDKRAVLSK